MIVFSLVEPAPQQHNDGQYSGGGGGAYSFDVNKTNHQSYPSFPAAGGQTHQQDSAQGTGLLDDQFVPETGQQVTGEKDKDIREGEVIQTSSVGPPHYNKVGPRIALSQKFCQKMNGFTELNLLMSSYTGCCWWVQEQLWWRKTVAWQRWLP